ncbi:hypothetical protein BDV98DRAFT_192631 [Pterulicium gracile]|uniref:Uncharacterized protein n=1 Tax=Pterulicium gracile TaxID=1884261 RepID=A0A5C3QFW3_9AGAR|nr:hypothetical protein BDV98DRAFT_192631 [Pterula gracilis]
MVSNFSATGLVRVMLNLLRYVADAWLYEPSNPNTSQVQPSLYPPVTPYVKSYNDSSATQSTSDMIPPVPYLKSYGTSESTWTPNYGTGTHTDHSPFESTLLIPSPGASSNQQADSARPPWEEPRRTEHTTSEPSVAQPDELRDVVRTLMERMNAIERPPPYVDESRARNTRSASG